MSHTTLRKVELIVLLMNYDNNVVARLIQQKYKIYNARIKNEFVYNWSFMVLIASSRIISKFLNSDNRFSVYSIPENIQSPRNVFQTHCSRSSIGWFQLRSTFKFLN